MQNDEGYGQAVRGLGWACGDIVVARTFWCRLWGLMGHRPRGRGNVEIILVFPRCSSVHTFGMGASIDVVFFTDDNRVLARYERVVPGRILAHRGASWVCERIHVPPDDRG